MYKVSEVAESGGTEIIPMDAIFLPPIAINLPDMVFSLSGPIAGADSKFRFGYSCLLCMPGGPPQVNHPGAATVTNRDSLCGIAVIG